MNTANSIVISFSLLTAGWFAAAPAASAETDPAIVAAIEDLLDTIDMSKSAEEPRLGRLENGGLMFFGAPVGSAAETDSSKSGAVEKARAFLMDNAVAFGMKSFATSYIDFELERDQTVDSRRYLRFQQTYDDLPVFCGEAIVQLDEEENVAAAICDLMVETASFDAQKSTPVTYITLAEAEDAAIDAAVAQYVQEAEDANVTLTAQEIQDFRDDRIILGNPELKVFDPAVIEFTGTISTIYYVEVGGIVDTMEKSAFLIDAINGDSILNYPLVYDCAYTPNRTIKDQANNGWMAPIVVREEGDPVCGIADADAVYDIFGDVFDFYCEHHGRNSIDNQGMGLNATVRICPRIFNTTCGFDCPCPNAYSDPETGTMAFGEGMVIDDVVGHELTHGVTACESQLIYFAASGGINESLSDIWGEFIDLTNGTGNDDPSVRWLLGEDAPMGAIRDMANPTDFNQPDCMSSFWYQYQPIRDNFDVHRLGGVNNKLCYLLTDGSVGEVGGSFRGRTITPMGINLVAELYYECQTHLLTPSTHYYRLYYTIQQAAINLGLSVQQRQNIEEACKAVEIRPSSFIAIYDADTNPILRFTNAGDVVLLNGADVYTNQTISSDPNVGEVILRDSTGTAFGKVDGTAGDLYLAGELHENLCMGWDSLWDWPDEDYLAIRNEDETVAFINGESFFELLLGGWVPAGSLMLDGHIVHMDLQ